MSLDHAIQHLVQAEARLTELKKMHDVLTKCIPTFSEHDQPLVAAILDCLDPYRDPEERKTMARPRKPQKITEGDGDPRHGTYNGYQNLDCRCTPCTKAHSAYLAERKRIRVAKGPPDHVHGTPGGYGNWDCRCRPCTDAWSADTLARAHRRKEAERVRYDHQTGMS